MPTPNDVKFYLKKPGGSSKTPIYAKFSYIALDRAERLQYYKVKESVKPEHWNPNKMRVKPLFQIRVEAEETNDRLDELETIIIAIYREYVKRHRIAYLTPTLFKKEIDKRFWGSPQDVKKNNRMMDFITEYVNRVYPNSPKYNASTHKAYKTLLEHLSGFLEGEEMPWDLDTINLQFFRAFRGFLMDEKGQSKATAKKYMFSCLRPLLKVAYVEGLTKNDMFQHITPGLVGVTVPKPETIYLTRAQIKKLYEHDLSNNPKLERVKDTFICACLTGLRWKNWKDINQGNIIEKDGAQLLDIWVEKNDGKRAVIPVHPIIGKILHKYRGSLPIISDQKTRDYIKDACKAAGLTEEVKRKDESFPIYTQVGTHTARRTFVSNGVRAGIPKEDLQMMIAHSVPGQTIDQYDRRSLIERAVQYSQHKYFTEL